MIIEIVIYNQPAKPIFQPSLTIDEPKNMMDIDTLNKNVNISITGGYKILFIN
jgi:hypothetical protein